MKVSISRGNSKMGPIPSVSLPAGITCPNNCACYKECYAVKLARFRPNVRDAYTNNYKILMENPEEYWRQVEEVISTSRFFRYHVCGDIPNADYLDHMVRLSEKYPGCDMLCYTKKYDLVNNYIRIHGKPNKNLHILFSIWRGMLTKNPYNLPEAHVLYKDGRTTASPHAFMCINNCISCARCGVGCYGAKYGDQVLMKEH